MAGIVERDQNLKRETNIFWLIDVRVTHLRKKKGSAPRNSLLEA